MTIALSTKDQIQYERMIRVSRDNIQMDLDILPRRYAEKNGEALVGFQYQIATEYWSIALFRWRQDEDPRPDMKTGFEWLDKAMAAIAEWRPDPATANSFDWGFAGAMTFIGDHPLVLDFELERPSLSGTVVDRLLWRALYDEPWQDKIEEPLAEMAIKRRNHASKTLRIDSYRNYFAILEAGARGEDVTDLVREGERLFKRRRRTVAGVCYQGYDLYNDWVIDWQLAAVIKKVGWQGESIHRYRWA